MLRQGGGVISVMRFWLALRWDPGRVHPLLLCQYSDHQPTEGAAMSLPDDAEKSAIVARVQTFTAALDQLTLDPTAQERCLAASHDVMRLLQGLINRLSRP